MYNTRTRNTSATFKGSDAAVKGFPKGNCPASERKPRFSAQKRLDRTRINPDKNLWVAPHDKLAKWTHTREDWARKTQKRTPKELRSSAGRRKRELTNPLFCLKTQTLTRLTKSSHLQQALPWRCTRPQFPQHGPSPGVKILEQPVATLMQCTDHLGRLACAGK